MIRLVPLLILATVARADDAAKKVAFADVAAIFQNRCNSCHNGDKQKGGLSLDTFGTAMTGGASGKVIEAGDSGNSRLYSLVSHSDEPKMPPKADKLPEAELKLIKDWIDDGALETAGSVAAAKKKMDFKLDPSAIGKPTGPAAMPAEVSTDPPVLSARPNAVTAMAASPWAPLVAVAGHKQVLLYHTQTFRLLGVLPFPEGTIHTLKFSRDGGLVMAGGGRGGQSGRVVAWDVITGKRLFEVGKEYDVVMAADVSPDRSMVALGGPGKVLKVYGTGDNEVIYESKKHTEWVTAVEFSPDGVLLASGDRNGGLVVWEAATGREFYDLRSHTTSITDVSWRIDSNVLASCSEDTTIRLWEMGNGTQVKGWGGHGGGVSSIRFAKDGRLVSTGRDNQTKMWDQNGGQQRAFEGFSDQSTEAVFTHDDAAVIAGDYRGEVRVWDAKDGKRLGNLSANPASLASRLEKARGDAAAAQAAADNATKELPALQADVAAKAGQLGKANDALAKAKSDLAAATTARDRAQGKLNDAYRAEWSANDTAWATGFAESRMSTIWREVAGDVYRKVEAADNAANVLAQTGMSRDKLLAEKAAAALVAASQASASAVAAIGPVVEATRAAQVVQRSKQADRLAAEAPMVALRSAAGAANTAVPARAAELAAITSAKAAADKALAERSGPIQTAIATAAGRKAEVDALAAEKKRAEASGGVASAAKAP